MLACAKPTIVLEHGAWADASQGDTAFGLTAARPGSCLDSANAFTAVPYPGAPAGDFDAYLKVGPDAPYPRFAQCFANGCALLEHGPGRADSAG